MSYKWNNYTFDPESYLEGLSPFGTKVMRKLLETWNQTEDDQSSKCQNIQVLKTSNNLDQPRASFMIQSNHNLIPSDCCNEDKSINEKHNEETNRSIDDFDGQYSSPVTSDITSIPNHRQNLTQENNVQKKKTFMDDGNIFSEDQLETFNKKSKSFISEEFAKESIDVLKDSPTEKKRTYEENEKSKSNYINKLSKYNAPPKRPKLSGDVKAVKLNVNINEGDKLIKNGDVTENEIHKNTDELNILPSYSQYNKNIIFSQKTSQLTKDISQNHEDHDKTYFEEVKNDDDVNYLEKDKNSKDNKKPKKKLVKPKNMYVLEIDKTKKSKKKQFNQLKLSDMLTSQKIKKKTMKAEKPKLSKIEKKTQKFVNTWLDKTYEFVDTEIIENIILSTKDLGNLDPNDKFLDNNQNISNSNNRSKTLIDKFDNKIQAVIAIDDGKMSFKKCSELIETSLPNQAIISKKKPQFVPPIQKVIPVENINFCIIHLDEKQIDELNQKISLESPTEIGITILYKEGFCQLNKIPGNIDITCSPKALMFCIAWNEDIKYYLLNVRGMSSSEKTSKKLFISQVMSSNIRIMCFESQDLLMLLIDLFEYKREEVCLKWVVIDPKIGCFLLDPDKPPVTFDIVLSQLSIEVDFESSNPCPKQKAAWCLSLLSESCKVMHSKLNENNIWHLFYSMETKIITVLTVMELRGIFIDTKVLNEMAAVLNENLNKIENKAYQAAGRSFQLNSLPQLRNILFDELKLDTKQKIAMKETLKLGAKSTSEPVLRQLVSLHPLPGLILNYRHIYKAKATFVDAILQHCKGGIIRTSWEQVSAATGRIVSSNPNLQAIPRKPIILELFPDSKENISSTPRIMLRNAFIPRPLYTFIAADFQHIELRVFAHMTQEKVLIDSFRQNIDVFNTLAMKWMKKDISEIQLEDRDKTKRLVYALMYGAGTQKLMEILHLGYKEVMDITSKFLDSFPSLWAFRETIIKKCHSQNGILYSISGRMRKFQNINSNDSLLRSNAERQAINFVIQGSAADLCKIAMLATEHRLSNLPESLDHHLLLQIHDELVWEVPDQNVEQFKDLVQEVMQHSGEFCGKLSVPLPVAITQGKSWGNML